MERFVWTLEPSVYLQLSLHLLSAFRARIAITTAAFSWWCVFFSISDTNVRIVSTPIFAAELKAQYVAFSISTRLPIQYWIIHFCELSSRLHQFSRPKNDYLGPGCIKVSRVAREGARVVMCGRMPGGGWRGREGNTAGSGGRRLGTMDNTSFISASLIFTQNYDSIIRMNHHLSFNII